MGLREEKKAATRQSISNVATALFLERGFDAVSVADVAAAARVSKMTVFNYFARKEDLLFDRTDEALALLREAIVHGARREAHVDRVLSLAQRLVAERHVFTSWSLDVSQYFEMVRASPALVARLRELREVAEGTVAHALREAAETRADDVVADVLAAGLVTAWMKAHGVAATAREAGKTEAATAKLFLRVLDAALDPLRQGAKGTPYDARLTG